MIDLNDQIKCVRREIQLRERFYPSFIRRGKMTPADADYQLRAMREVLRTLERVATEGEFKLT